MENQHRNAGAATIRRVRRRVLPSALLREHNGGAVAAGVPADSAIPQSAETAGNTGVATPHPHGAVPTEDIIELLYCDEVFEIPIQRVELFRALDFVLGPPESECPVCLKTLEYQHCVRTERCKHHFHSECITRWAVEYRNSCPVCRATLVLPPAPDTGCDFSK